jgi:hypothetical protein
MIKIPQRNDYSTRTEYLDARWASLLEEVGDVSAIDAADGVDRWEIISRAWQRSQLVKDWISFESKFEDETVMEDDNDSTSQGAESDSKVDAEWSFLDTNYEDSGGHYGDCDTNSSFVGVDTDGNTANDDEWSSSSTKTMKGL